MAKYSDLFDLDHDGERDALEHALEYSVIHDDEDIDFDYSEEFEEDDD